MQLRTTQSWGRYAPNRLQAWACGQSNARPKSVWGSLCRRMVLTGLRNPLDVQRWGANFRLYPTDNLCEKRVLLSPNTFDVLERNALAKRMHENFRFVDVGANVGLYSLFVAAHPDFNGQVLAIEPQPVIKDRLLFNLRANPKCSITHEDCAVSNKKGLSRMGISRQNLGASGFQLRSGRSPDDEFMVQTVPLDELIDRHKMQGADALKIDIEGAEDQVLPLFFEQTAPQDLPKLLILERNETWEINCIALALTCGYVQVAQAHMNVVLEKK